MGGGGEYGFKNMAWWLSGSLYTLAAPDDLSWLDSVGRRYIKKKTIIIYDKKYYTKIKQKHKTQTTQNWQLMR
ncbi:hypothetical protein JP0183_15030 [Helicobacter pylori]